MDSSPLDVVGSDQDSLLRRQRTEDLPHALDPDRGVPMPDHPVLLCIDFDGVLAPIVRDPSAAAMLPDNRELLRSLNDHHHLAIVSGRPLNELVELVGLPELDHWGSHGAERLTNGRRHDCPEAAAGAEVLARCATGLRDELEDLGDDLLIETKASAVTAHTRKLPRPAARRVAESAKAIAEHEDLILTGGKEVHELRLPTAPDKGDVVQELLTEVAASGASATAWFIGDDETDEDAFRAIGAKGVTIAVGRERRTSARHHLADPTEVSVLLARLAASRSL